MDKKEDLSKIKEYVISNFKCDGCGNCCVLDKGFVYCTPEETKKIAKFLEMDLLTFLSEYTIKEKGWTILSSPKFNPHCFLDQHNMCSIYDVRPEKCRIYPNWNSIWKDFDSFLKEAETCPSLKKAYDKYLNLINL